MYERKAVFKDYFIPWFFIDIFANIPISIFKAFPRAKSGSDTMNVIRFNFAYTPRVFIMILLLKLTRIRKAKEPFVRFLKWIDISVGKRNLILTLWNLALILHLIACFWGSAAGFNVNSYQNWSRVA